MDKNIVNLSAFREKKEAEKDISRGRTPLHMSHLDGKVTGSPHFKRPQADDFGDRMQRIKSSLEKINRLMADLKKNSRDKDFQD
ncbi:MAG: hypothetical protein HRU19_17710 [Pseudobacteriovorax sp.]|nr:hypothetical protein [Pseudobacteriovorax sp.]